MNTQNPCDVIKDNDETSDPFSKLSPLKNSNKQLSSGFQKSIHGILYQLKLLMLFLCRAVNKGYSFRLTTEWDAAEKFDDLVFAYESADKSIVYRFLQAKHKQCTDSRNFITERNLFHERHGDFDVEKYFISYRKIKQNPLFIADNVELRDFIISTNTDIDRHIEYLFDQLTDEDDILDTQGSTSRRLKFNDVAKEIFKVTLHNCSDVGQLAKKLSECVLKNKRIDFQDELFKTYHNFLVNNVFNVEDCKFFDIFFDSDELSVLRNLFMGCLQIPNNLDIINKPPVIENIKKLIGFVQLKRCSTGSFVFTSTYLRKILTHYVATNFEETQIELIIKSKLQIRKEFKSARTNCISSSMILLLKNSVTQEEIEDFLNRFVFAVGQPNESKLTEIISSELDEKFNISAINDVFSYNNLLSVMLDWLKNKNDSFLGHTEGNNFLNHIKQSLDSVKLQILTVQHDERINNFDLEFLPANLELICFHLKKSYILNIVNPCQVVFTSAKVLQILKSPERFGIVGPHIYINSKQFIDLQLCVENILQAGRVQVLILELDSDDVFELYDVYMWIIKMLNLRMNSKIILISKSNEELPKRMYDKMSSEHGYIQLCDEGNCFGNITPQSQDLLLGNTIIDFYDQRFPLQQLVHADEFKAVISNTQLIQFIGNKIAIGKPYKTQPLEYCYIQQNCSRSIIISNDIKYDTDNFCVTDKDNVVIDPYKDLLFISDDESKFRDLCEKQCRSNIHWLLEECNTLKWQKSYGRINKIRSYLAKNFTLDYKINTICDIRDRSVIISGMAGMGKSSLLSHVLNNIRTSTDGSICWVEKINLIDHSTTLKSMKDGHIDDDVVLKFLHTAFSIDGYESSLARALFNYYYSNNEIILLLDGFDEISPNYKQQVISILGIVKKKVKRLWITTRPYDFQRELEDELSTIPYVLQPFDSLQVRAFLELYWSNSIGNINHEQFYIFVDEIFSQFSRRTDDYQGNFMKIPLQTFMVGQVFKELFRMFQSTEYTSLPNDVMKQIQYRLNLVTFYREFVTMKIKEKTRDLNIDKPYLGIIYKNAENSFINLYMDLALCDLFPYENLEVLFNRNIKKFYSVVENFNDTQEKFGIIDRVVEGIPRFIHRTLAEYFAALWFCQNFHAYNVKQFLRNNMFNAEFNIINQFMNNLLCMDYENLNTNNYGYTKIDGRLILHNLVLNNDYENLLKVDVTDVNDCFTHTDQGGRTIFHVVAYSGSQSTMDVLLEIMPSHYETIINLKDNFLQMSALSYTIAFQKWGRCEFLLKLGAEHSDVYDYIKKLSTLYDTGQINNLLFLVIRKGYLELLKLYLKCTSTKNSHSVLMLFCAIKYERLDIVKYLVNNFGNIIKSQDNFGNTALHMAADIGNVQIFAWLLQNGSVLKSINNFGNDALYCALDSHKTEIAKFIYDTAIHGIDLGGKCSRAILISAVMRSNLELTNHLISKGIYIHIFTTNGKTLLHEAVQRGEMEITKCLVEAGININATDVNHRTALHYALDIYNSYLLYENSDVSMYIEALNARVQMCKYLITKGIAINIVDKNGFSALHIATQCNFDKGARHLIDAGINLNTESCKGDIAFYFALRHCNLKIAKYMVKCGFDINTKNKSGETALHTVAQSGNTRSAKFLISHGINISIEDKNGNTALCVAIKHNNVPVAKLLINTGYHCATADSHDKITFHNSPGDIKNFNVGSLNGRTALHIAAEHDNIEIGRYIIMSGFAVNSVDLDGLSALHIAAQHGYFEFAKFLIKVGGDCYLIDKNGHNLEWHFETHHGHKVILEYQKTTTNS